MAYSVNCSWCGKSVEFNEAWITERKFVTKNHSPQKEGKEPVKLVNKDTLFFCTKSHRNEFLYGL